MTDEQMFLVAHVLLNHLAAIAFATSLIQDGVEETEELLALIQTRIKKAMAVLKPFMDEVRV